MHKWEEVKGEAAILYLYLIIYPDYPYNISKTFERIGRRKKNFPKSLTNPSHVSSILTKLEKGGFVKKEEKKIEGKPNRHYYDIEFSKLKELRSETTDSFSMLKIEDLIKPLEIVMGLIRSDKIFLIKPFNEDDLDDWIELIKDNKIELIKELIKDNKNDRLIELIQDIININKSGLIEFIKGINKGDLLGVAKINVKSNLVEFKEGNKDSLIKEIISLKKFDYITILFFYRDLLMWLFNRINKARQEKEIEFAWQFISFYPMIISSFNILILDELYKERF